MESSRLSSLIVEGRRDDENDELKSEHSADATAGARGSSKSSTWKYGEKSLYNKGVPERGENR